MCSRSYFFVFVLLCENINNLDENREMYMSLMMDFYSTTVEKKRFRIPGQVT